MPVLPDEEARILKAQVFDMDEKSCKQALFGMVNHFKNRSSISLQPFRLLIEEAAALTKVLKENRKEG